MEELKKKYHSNLRRVHLNLDKKEEDKESQHTGVEEDSGEYSDPDNEENFVTKG